MATPYCTPAQLAQVIGRDHLIAAAPDPDQPDAWHAPPVLAALEAVAARVRAAYRLPLADVPVFLTRAVARLTHAELVTEATSTELIQSRAAEAWRLVTDLATGAALDTTDEDADGAANPRTRQGRAIRTPWRMGSRASKRFPLLGRRPYTTTSPIKNLIRDILGI